MREFVISIAGGKVKDTKKGMKIITKWMENASVKNELYGFNEDDIFQLLHDRRVSSFGMSGISLQLRRS